jgi:hypothetical protein
MPEDKRLNAAYGSNLHLPQMAERCPTAKVVGKGLLKGFRLRFKGLPDEAYLSIERNAGSQVPVLVWELLPSDEEALDIYEDYPRLYTKKDVPIVMEDGSELTVMVYVMIDTLEDDIEINLPSARYLGVVREGYAAAGFDPQYVEEALAFSQEHLNAREISMGEKID